VTKVQSAVYDMASDICPARRLGAEVVSQRAAKGDGEAQFSLGFVFVSQADGQADRPWARAADRPRRM